MRYWLIGCCAAVAVAGAQLPVHAAELEDFTDETVIGTSPLPTTEIEFESSPSPTVGFPAEGNWESDTVDGFVPDFSPSPDIDYIFNDDLPDDSVITGDGFIDDYTLEEDIDPYANYNTYYGSIGSTYLEYMRGFLPKLGFRDHYVCSRVGQYDYIFAYGEGLSWSGSIFSGHNIMVVKWNTYNNGTFSYAMESSFNLIPGSYLVYSDLTTHYPSLADSSAFSLRQILILLTIVFLVMCMVHMYQVRRIRR